MDVKFITTVRNLVDTVPITDGQVIACKDHDDMFYDMDMTRYRIGAQMWEPAETDTVTPGFTMNDATVGVIQFVPNGGNDISVQSGSPDNFVVGTAGELIGLTELPTCTRQGFEFLGWYEDQTTQQAPVEVFPSRYPVGKIIYYASWRQL